MIYVFDADDVLCAWMPQFKKYVKRMGYETRTEDPLSWHLEEWFFDVTDPRQIIKDFQDSDEYKNLPILDGAFEYVTNIPSNKVYVVTSCGDSEETVRERKNLLRKLFNGHIWESRIVCLPLGGSKKDALQRIYDEHGQGVFIDDHFKNIIDGVSVGFKTYLVTTHHNSREIVPDCVTRINKLTDIQKTMG